MLVRALSSVRGLTYRLLCSALLLAACGGKSGSDSQNTSSGGAPTSAGSGGALSGDGGSTSGGSAASGGTVTQSGGATQMPNCAKVTCPAIPTTCKRLVQDPNECCPTCLDSGCDVCPQIKCAAGTHSETVAGDCCPSCVADPPDACEEGQKNYAALRDTLIEKYSSTKCQNSSDCKLVTEDNECAYVCNVALPSATVESFVSNLKNSAMGCSTCARPAPQACELLAACVNGKCIATPPK